MTTPLSNLYSVWNVSSTAVNTAIKMNAIDLQSDANSKLLD
jgi:hypothetical protein